MTDQEIENDRKSLTPPIPALYVDARAEERSRAVYKELLSVGAIPGLTSTDEETDELLDAVPYQGDGTMVRPFVTLEEARAVQKPGQGIVITGYATIGPKAGSGDGA